MSFVGNQIVNFMVSKIKQNNPKMAPYINELMSGGNSQQVLIKAINDGAINRQQWNSINNSKYWSSDYRCWWSFNTNFN